MAQVGEGPNNPIVLHGDTGSVTLDFRSFGISILRPLPVEYGVLEHTAWLRLDAETAGMFAAQYTGPITTASTYRTELLADAPRVWYRLNEPAGAAEFLDSGPNNLKAVTVGANTASVPGLLRSDTDAATQFGGVRGEISASNDYPAWSAEAWIKTPDAGTNQRTIVGRANSQTDSSRTIWYLDLINNVPRFVVANTTGVFGVAQGTTKLNDNQPHHLVGTYTSGGIELYVDGEWVANGTLPGNPNTYDAKLTVGGHGDHTRLFSGVIDEVAYYDTALPASRVQTHYQAGVDTSGIWQGVLEMYEKSAAWGTDAYYVDWWTLLAAVPPGEQISVPLTAGQSVYIRAHPFNTGDPAPDAILSWLFTPVRTNDPGTPADPGVPETPGDPGTDPTPATPPANTGIVKFYGEATLTTAEPGITQLDQVVVDEVRIGGDGTLIVEDFSAAEIQTATNVDVSSSGQLTVRLVPRGTVRWQFHDSHESESWTLPMNPNAMTSPHAMRQYKYGHGVDRGLNRIRVFELPHDPISWEFSGYIRTKQHHDELRRWADKQHEIEITDHLDRTFEVIIQHYAPEDRVIGEVPLSSSLSDERRWRMRYKMTALILRRVS